MKKFNITGICIPEKHYMVDISNKIQKIIAMVDEGSYFTINRPRQYGKTTTLFLLEKELQDRYLLISTSFEGLGDEAFENASKLSYEFINQILQVLKYLQKEHLIRFIQEYKKTNSLNDLSNFITNFVNASKQKVVLIIDEVDRASNHLLFLNFLGMLRNKYLLREAGKDHTFHSVILAGVHDIKNIKMKIRSESEAQYNSPWNIATEFKVDLSFSSEEIKTMLEEYFSISQLIPNYQSLITNLSNKIYKFTSGYPFLVSKICKLIDEELDKDWTLYGIQNAVALILEQRNTLFDDLIKNVENHKDLYELLHSLLINEKDIIYNIDNPIIDKGVLFGIIKKDKQNRISISNKIFEIRLYNYITSKIELSHEEIHHYTFQDDYLDNNSNLDIEKILLKFQEFIKETYSDKDTKFYERNGRLLLIAFIKPIINGAGFYYIESQYSYERRMDMIITYNKKEYILEFKLWYGKEYHEKSLKQLASYLDTKNHTKGYLVTFNFNKNKEFKYSWNDMDGKKIFEVML